jgi:hypothetical protein
MKVGVKSLLSLVHSESWDEVEVYDSAEHSTVQFLIDRACDDMNQVQNLFGKLVDVGLAFTFPTSITNAFLET